MFTLPDDPYAALGVSQNAQVPEIRSAHRKLVLKCHPDKVSDPALKAVKQEEFQRVQKAYELLSDENERQKYDDMVRANELERENAERRRQRDREREPTPGRTPRYESDFGRVPHFTVQVKAEPPPGFSKPSAFPPSHMGSKSPYASARTPPRSFEENIQSSYDEVREARRSRKVVYEAPRHDEEKRSRRKELERKEQDRKEQERKERRREEKRKAEKDKEKIRDQERRREADEKRAPRHKAPYVEDESDYAAPNLSPGKPEKKSKASSRAKDAVPKELPLDREHKQNSNLEFAANYLARSKGPGPSLNPYQHFNVRHVSPPPAVATPPPAAAGLDDEEPVKRSSARRRMSHDTPRAKDKSSSSSHKKSTPSHQDTPPSVPESPPRFARAHTEHYSRPMPGPMPSLSRAATWRGDGGDVPDHGRSRHARGYSDGESEGEMRPRRSRRARSPDDGKVRYSVHNGRAVPMNRSEWNRDESPVGRKSKHGHYEANMGRPMERRPAMPSYDSYGSHSSQVFEKVKISKAYNPEEVVYGNVAHASSYRGAEVYTY